MNVKIGNAASFIIRMARNGRDEQGRAILTTAEVAILILDRLNREYPEDEFRVRQPEESHEARVHIGWVDGPGEDDVDLLLSDYSFDAFCGINEDRPIMTTNWLLPDGTMKTAECPDIPSIADQVVTDCPAPGAVIVMGGVVGVECHREISYPPVS